MSNSQSEKLYKEVCLNVDLNLNINLIHKQSKVKHKFPKIMPTFRYY
jgi:hypothetical protein